MVARKSVAKPVPIKPEIKPKPSMAISQEMLWRSRQPRIANNQGQGKSSPFAFRDLHPPSARPAEPKLAMDDSIYGVNLNWATSALNSAWYDGQAFLGFPELAVLLQRAEYRSCSEIIAQEMTRKGIKFQAKGDIDKTERIADLQNAFKEFDVIGKFREVAFHGNGYGRGHLYIDTGYTDDVPELTTDLGDGWNDTSKAKVKQGSIKGFRSVEPVWVYPQLYEASDPLKKNWYNPQQWLVNAKPVHVSRLLLFVPREVGDLLKPAYSFGGLSLTQMVKPTVENWLRTRQSVSDIVKAFSVFVLSTDLSTSLQAEGQRLFERVELFNNLRDNQGLMVLNEGTEDFKNVSASLAGLSELQPQSLEHIASLSRIPTIIYTGIEPAGLNPSSDGSIRIFQDWILSSQESLFRKPMHKIMGFMMLHLWGETDDDIEFVFEPLWSLNEKEMAEVKKIEAETDTVLIDHGVLSPSEVRTQLAADPDTRYAGLDIEEVPDLKEEEEQGLVVRGGRGESGNSDNGDDEGSDKAEDMLNRLFDASLRL